MRKKAAWGGRRAGAGRKPERAEGPLRCTSVQLPHSLVARLDAEVTAGRAKSRSEALVLAAERGLILLLGRTEWL